MFNRSTPATKTMAASATRPTAPLVAQPTAVEHDVACGIALGVIDGGATTVTLETITRFDPTTRKHVSRTGWLQVYDTFGELTRECLLTRQKILAATPRPNAPAWERARQIKEREEASTRFIRLRTEALRLLETRGVLAHARRVGMKILFQG